MALRARAEAAGALLQEALDDDSYAAGHGYGSFGPDLIERIGAWLKGSDAPPAEAEAARGGALQKIRSIIDVSGMDPECVDWRNIVKWVQHYVDQAEQEPAAPECDGGCGAPRYPGSRFCESHSYLAAVHRERAKEAAQAGEEPAPSGETERNASGSASEPARDAVAEARCGSCGKQQGEVGYCYIVDNHTGNETDGPCASTFHPENQDGYSAEQAAQEGGSDE